MIGNEEGTGDTSTLNPAPLGPPKNPSRNGYTPPTHRYNPKPIPQKENLSTISSGHPHSCLKTHKYAGNAFKCGEPPVHIEAERVGDFVELRVRDHGPGVPAEFVFRLFTKFDRGDTPATRATQGTGLGLSIVKALAEANHGDASYQRDEPKGGCFVVRLPAAAA